MIDLHCHIIPMVDDGARNASVACEMAAHAYRNGIDTIVATPHCNLRGARSNYRGRLYTEFFSLFRALLRQREIPVRLLPGAELFAHPSNLRRLLDERRVVTLNHSRYLLTEFNFQTRGEDISDALDLIAKRGLVPVVAHPERYVAVQHDLRFVGRWFAKGYVIQINKGSLLGRLGYSSQITGEAILTAGLAHVIATDAHDMKYRPTGFRTLLPYLHEHCPQEYITLLLEKNPNRIISDEPIPVPKHENIIRR